MLPISATLILLLSSCAAAQYSCPVGGVACGKGDIAGGYCCVPRNGKMVLALQWLPGYCVGVTDACTHDVMDRIPSDEWTIHGLWPNSCSNQQIYNCDRKREHTDIEERLRGLSPYTELKRTWVSFNGDYNNFWSHEWNKHGTCYSPSNPECLSTSNTTDVEHFFSSVITLKDKYNIYKALEAHNIVPSKTTVYTPTDIKLALTKEFGTLTVAIRCKGVYLSEIRLALVGVNPGIAQNGVQGLPSSCPRKGIRYIPGHMHAEKLVIQENL